LSAVGADKKLVSAQLGDVEGFAQLIGDLKAALSALDAAVEKAEAEDLDKKATALAYGVSDAMVAVREVCDKLELVIDDGLWPLPKYREMLFLF
jgi:glutamine synthetase